MEKQEVDININITVTPSGNNRSGLEINHQEKTEKLKVSISVAQLAYIFRVLTDMKVIESDNISEVIRFVSNNISTPHAENISVDSLRTRFYNPSKSSIQFFHDLIIGQLNHVRKELKKV